MSVKCSLEPAKHSEEKADIAANHTILGSWQTLVIPPFYYRSKPLWHRSRLDQAAWITVGIPTMVTECIRSPKGAQWGNHGPTVS